jgi:haloalkane dehalogenase
MTGKHMFGIRQDWVSDELFPFESRFFDSQHGRMHYIDEGQGEPIVFVHGNPTWSFEFRGPVSRPREQFRCVAPDHIGFGLPQRSQASDGSHPQAHAENFAALLDHLQLQDVTLYLTDWGGPVGLAFARRYPERVRRIIVANTWCCPVNNGRHFVMFSPMMSSGIGRFMIRRFNFFVNRVMPRAVGDRKILTPEVMRHYRRALPDWGSRYVAPTSLDTLSALQIGWTPFGATEKLL